MCLEMKCNKIYHCALATRNATDLIDLMFICYIWQHKTQHDQNCHFSFRPTFKSSPDSKSNHTCEVKYISSYIQLNKYETDPYILQIFQSNTSVCLIISLFCKSCEPMLCEPEIVQNFCS